MKAMTLTPENPSRAIAVKSIFYLVGLMIISLGSSLAIKASAGLSAWDAIALTLSMGTGIKVGTIAIVFNGSCIVGQLLLERRNFRPLQFLQVINVFGTGMLINFFVYNAFAGWHPDNYLFRLGLLAMSYAVIAFGVMLVMETGLIRNPLEGLMQVLADMRGKPMGRYRQLADIVFIAAALAMTLFFRTDLTIREGTVICMLIFGPLLDFYKKPVRRLMDQLL